MRPQTLEPDPGHAGAGSLEETMAEQATRPSSAAIGTAARRWRTVARGCSITVEVLRRQEVKRLRPRPNPDVNSYWVCDYGRHHYEWINQADRVDAPLARGDEVVHHRIGIQRKNRDFARLRHPPRLRWVSGERIGGRAVTSLRGLRIFAEFAFEGLTDAERERVALASGNQTEHSRLQRIARRIDGRRW